MHMSSSLLLLYYFDKNLVVAEGNSLRGGLIHSIGACFFPGCLNKLNYFLCKNPNLLLQRDKWCAKIIFPCYLQTNFPLVNF